MEDIGRLSTGTNPTPVRRTITRGARIQALTAAFTWLICFLATPVLASQEHHIIFLVDQSGSMWRNHGPNDLWRGNDPLGNRYEPVLQTYEKLQTRLDAEQDTQTAYTLHVVEFAGDVRLSLTERIEFEPGRPATVQDLRETKNRLKGELNTRGLQDGETNHLKGLREALKIVQSLEGVPPEQIMALLITDGKPYVGGWREGEGARYKSQLENAALSLRASVALFDVIGINARENRRKYWEAWRPFWDEVSSPDTTYEVEEATEVSPLVDQIIRNWLGLPAPRNPESPFYCPPYLRSIKFTAYKAQLGGQIEIWDAQNRQLEAGMPDVTITDEQTYSIYTIQDPPPGLWRVQTVELRDLTVEPLYRRIHRRQPAGAVSVGFPERFRFEVLSDGGHPFQELSQYPIQAELGIQEASGSSRTLQLTSEGDGIFVSESYTFRSPGIAQLQLRATTQLPNQDATVFSHDEQLAVSGQELLVLNAGETLPKLAEMRFGRIRLQPEIRLERFEPEGQTVVPRSVSSSPDRLLKIRLIHHDGTEIENDGSRWRDVRISESGLMTAELPFQKQLLSWHYLIRRPIQLFAQVRVTASALNEQYSIRELRRQESPELDESMAFQRGEALPDLLDDPLTLTIVARESLATSLRGLAGVAVVAMLAFYPLIGLLYLLSDRLRKKSPVVVIRGAGGGKGTVARNDLFGKARLNLRGSAVGIKIGEDLDDPDWKPDWIKIKRVFRPWTKRPAVRLSYPVRVSGKLRTRTTVIEARDRPTPLKGMGKAEALLEIHDRG